MGLVFEYDVVKRGIYLDAEIICEALVVANDVIRRGARRLSRSQNVD